MVLTRSQARARIQQANNDNANQTSVTTRSSRKRTTTMTPKARVTTHTAGRPKAKPKGGRKPPQPAASTPERTFARAWPDTPRAPRKSDVQALKSDFPTHFASSPYPSVYGTPLVMSMDDIDNSQFCTSTQHPGQRVRFDVENLTLISPPAIGDDLSSNASTIVSSELPHQYRPQFHFPSSRDIVESIPGNWVRSPGECSRRLALVAEDTNAHGERERELADQARVNQIFQQEYDRMMNDREWRHEEKFVRKNRGLKRENAMIL
ncbi:hypothetical protein PQX77_006056 [Marasmius sp. AFHP31]|nr:hypothetical protein PQX77_006056 [Marasmius sp. AFHP31]